MITKLYASHSTDIEGGNSKSYVQTRKKKQSNHATIIAFTKNTSKAAHFGYHSGK